MKIAVTTQENQVFQHFGKCESFTVFDIDDGKIKGSTVIDAAGNGHSALADFLKDNGVEVLLCGGIGGGARQMLSRAGIEFVSGVEGNIEDAVKAYISGGLKSSFVICNHEDHEANHECSCENHCN